MNASQPTPERLKFHFLKSNYFRVIHADGAWGGVTPSGLIQMSLFSERHPIPVEITMGVENGRLGAEIEPERVTKSGVVRELEVDVVMTMETALSLRDWLNSRIDHLKSLRQTNAPQ